ncbi:non-ribosomal peptide synthetase [Cupriavidus oxalaticus]|uniref:Amino acid adenylation domain-containing protein n=1 Tax=Cupriavidus oxalaticus TaxID=96344 RepID=A0A5P3VK27_9BURK|nr:non-ribosomal peptide synthetase [Cupriavidus oxalaticus]QEZ46776.1 amino acid adenylation domain-containing protein [Cupriavidus oxalaticus]
MNSVAAENNALRRLAKRSLSRKFWADEFDAGWTRAELPTDFFVDGKVSTHVLHRKFRYDLYTLLLDRLAKEEGSIDEFLDGIVALAVSRLTAQEKLVLAYAEGATGSPHPLILDFAPPTGFREIMGHVASRRKEMREHAAAGTWQHYVALWQERGNAESPAAICLAHGRAGAVHAHAALSDFPVLIAIDVSEDALEISLRYDAAAIDVRTATSFLNVLEHLATLCSANLDITQSELVLSSEDDNAILAAVNATEVPFSDTSRIEDFLIDAAARHPDEIAIRSCSGDWSYANFLSKAHAVAAALHMNGVARGDVVAITAERSPEMVAGIFGVLLAGATYLPVDPAYPSARISYMLEDSRAKLVLLGDARLSTLIPKAVTSLALPDAIGSDPQAVGYRRPADIICTDSAYIIYTSGSTGNPKGVVVEHRSVVNRLQWMQNRYPLKAEDVLIQKTSVSFDVSVWELFWWSFAGASLCVPVAGTERNPEALVAEIARHRVSVIHFVPPMLSAFLGYLGNKSRTVASLRLVFASGEALTPKHIELFNALGAEASRPRLINLYGPTEATVDVTYFDCSDFSPQRARVPLGKPIDNTRIFVLDKFSRPLPVGFFGEIFIGGVGVARGYYCRPELTRERFLLTESLHGERLYRTGDIGRVAPDGLIEYAGRTDHQVKVRGFRIELQEVSTVIESLPGVKNCVALTGGAAGQNDTLLAFVKVEDASVTAQQLIEQAAAQLPAHQLPGQFILLDEFPNLPNGKIDRKALLRIADDSKASAMAAVAPRDEVEARLLEIWQAVLGRDDIGVTDNFFAVGGNSIHFVSILGKSRQAGLGFSFQDMFQSPTIAELRTRVNLGDVSDAAGSDEQPVRLGLLMESDRTECEVRFPDCEDAYPMTALQEGLVFEKELYIAAAQYHDVFTYTIEGTLDPETFKAAAQHLVDRNQIFRTSYHMSGFTQSIQVVHKNVAAQVFVDDLRGMSDAERQQWLDNWLDNERAYIFQWEQPDLVRFHVQILTDDCYLYTLSQHNSALDGWSISLVHSELFNTYFDLLAGRQLIGAVKKNYIRDYVALEKKAIDDGAQRTYWDGVLAASSQTLLPVHRRPRIGERFTVKYHPVEIGKTLSDALIGAADRLKVPVKSVLLAAHIKALSVLGDTEDVLTGYEHSGRPEVDGAADGVGLFLNTVPFRTRLAEESYADLIRGVYATEGEMLPNRRFPMARMKEHSGIKEILFESVFNYTHFYRLKELKKHQDFSLIEVEARGETEFALRAEFSRHFFDDNIKLNLHYHAEAFGEDFIATVAVVYARILQEIAEDVGRKHHQIDFVAGISVSALLEQGRQLDQDIFQLGPDECAVVVNAAGYLQPPGAYGELTALSAAASRTMTAAGRGSLPNHGVSRSGVAGRICFATNRFMVREQAASEVGQPLPTASGETALSPQSMQAVELIAQSWSQVLQVPRESISFESNFFDLGGTSILAMKSVLELRGVVSLVQLLTNSTLGPLVRSLGGGSDEDKLLHALVQGSEDDVALVYFPYAGGNAINFRDVANALRPFWPQLSIYGVELPGHDYRGGAADSCRRTCCPTGWPVSCAVCHSSD